MISFCASKFSAREDNEGEVKLTLVIPLMDAEKVLKIPVLKLLHVSIEVEEEGSVGI